MTNLESDPRRMLVDPPLTSLADYVAIGGGRALERARRAFPADLIDELDRSGLRGRGGAGFPVSAKWRSIRDGGGRHHFAVCNACEGEPGTFKDRALLRSNPYQVLEGLLVAGIVVAARETFIALKASFGRELSRIDAALGELSAAGWLDDVDVTVVAGPEEYLFGEEKALLEVIEGNDPLPRWLPPYLHGLYATAPQLGWQAHSQEAGHRGEHIANPTLISNAESLAQACWILANGAEAFRAVGTPKSPGTVVCTVVGDVARPGVVEVPMGTPLGAVIAARGGPRPGHRIKAVLPGAANAVIPASGLDVPLTHEDMEAAGSGLGAAGFIVYDETACMIDVAAMISRFLSVESCGQCLPCKLGTGDITAALERLRDGNGGEADITLIGERLQIVTDGSRCYLPAQEVNVISSVLRLFPEDVAAHIDRGCRSSRSPLPTPKILDLTDGEVVYDARQERKRPDWTYAEP
jgi:NADH-quinone oxidoreductase subunit F